METQTISPPVKKDPQVELIELKRAIDMFRFNIELKVICSTEPEKSILNNIIESESYTKMKSLIQPI